VLVFGSPKQRSSTGGLTSAQAARNLAEGLAAIAPYAAARGAPVLLEALSPDQTDVVTTLDEAAAIVRGIGHAGVQMAFDTHNAMAEVEPHEVLLDRHFELIRHVHVNEMDGRQPGSGAYDFGPVLEVLHRRAYAGWVSLEIFGVAGDAAEIAASSLQYLESVAERVEK
jgi:sugar phosphate isomerase/epimerase